MPNLPAPVAAYFEAEKGGPNSAPLAIFATDAVVTDEGRTYAGRAAIEAWWRAAKAQYRHTAQPQDACTANGQTIVRAMISGRFPGSPVLLSFTFRVVDGQIVELGIGT
jgi:hypothetical protein